MRKWILAGAALMASACASSPPPERNGPAPAPPKSDGSTPLPVKGRKPAGELTTNAAGRDIIKKTEGLELKAYELGGSDFIGYGHLMKAGEPDTISEATAEAYLQADLRDCEQALAKALTQPVSSNEFSALVSLCYNIGTGNLRSSSVVRLLNQGDRTGAAEAILLWNKAGGDVLPRLVERRRDEKTLFLKP